MPRLTRAVPVVGVGVLVLGRHGSCLLIARCGETRSGGRAGEGEPFPILRAQAERSRTTSSSSISKVLRHRGVSGQPEPAARPACAAARRTSVHGVVVEPAGQLHPVAGLGDRRSSRRPPARRRRAAWTARRARARAESTSVRLLSADLAAGAVLVAGLQRLRWPPGQQQRAGRVEQAGVGQLEGGRGPAHELGVQRAARALDAGVQPVEAGRGEGEVPGRRAAATQRRPSATQPSRCPSRPGRRPSHARTSRCRARSARPSCSPAARRWRRSRRPPARRPPTTDQSNWSAPPAAAAAAARARRRRVAEQRRSACRASVVGVLGWRTARPAVPSSRTRRNASQVAGHAPGRRRAIASIEDDPEALAAGVRRDVERRPRPAGAALSSSLTRPRNVARGARRPGTCARAAASLVAAAGDEQPQARARRQRPAAARRAAPAGPCAARRCGRGTRSSVPARCPATAAGRGAGEPVDVDPVGDDHRVAAEVVDDGAPGVLGDRDPAADLLQRGLQQRVGRRHRPRAQVWRCGRSPRSARAAAQQASSDRLGDAGSCRCRTSNSPSRSHRPHPGGGQRAEGEPGHRAVVADRDRAARRRRRRAAAAWSSSAGREHADLVALGDGSARPGRATWNCTPPGTSQEYGQTMPILTRPPGRPRAAAGARVEVVEPRPAAACASPAGARGCPAPKTSAHRLGHRGDLLAGGAARGHRHLVVEADDDPVPPAAGRPAAARTRPTPEQRRAGGRASAAGPAGIRAGCAEEVDLDAALGQVAVGEQGHERAAAQRRAAARGRRRCRRSAGGSRMPSDSRKATNRRTAPRAAAARRRW